jgi:methionyl aminopeptidase
VTRIPIKSAADIEAMREACRVTSMILDAVGEIVRPGISTEDINTFVDRMTRELGATPAPLNYKGFPKSVCTSPNDVVCHGIPSPYVTLKAGDIINIDVTSIKNGFHGDASRMYFVGGAEACTAEARELVQVTERALHVGIETRYRRCYPRVYSIHR